MELRRFVTKRTIAIAAVAIVLLAGAGVGLAATTGAFDPKAEQDAFEAAVAKKLGVTRQQLEDAYKAATLERLDAAVKEGRITQAQADELKKRVESGDFFLPFLGPLGRMGGPFPAGPCPLFSLDPAADYLGLTPAELREKLASGKSLADIAKDEGKSIDGLKKAMLDAAKKRLDQAVEDGKLTAAQRDELLQRLEAMIDDLINRTAPPSFPGYGGRPFGFGLHTVGRPPDV